MADDLENQIVDAGGCCLQSFQLYETRSKFYMTGRDNNKTFWRVLKINRLEPLELDVCEDAVTYSEQEHAQLLRRIDEGNKPTGGLRSVTPCYGIVGFFLSSCLHSSQGKPQNLSFQKKNGRSIDDRNDGICGSSMAVAATAAAVFLDYSNRSAGIRGDDVLCQNRGFGMSISARKKKKMAPLMVASTSIYTSKKTADSSGGKLTIVNDRDDRRYKLPLISPETLDEWMMESVVEIMKNIKQAPFLIHVFSNEEKSSKSSPSSLRLQTEPVQSRAWDSIKNRWTERRCSVPDGIILVEELRDSEEETETKRVDHSEFHSQSQAQPRSSNTRTWGLLVQGRGAVDCSACYILNTCRVLSSVGASTHFNLIRASCFGETAEAQLRNSWLQKR